MDAVSETIGQRTPAGPAKSTDPGRKRAAPPAWAVLLAVCAGQFLVVLDVSVVNVALPSMRGALGFGETGQQWVVNGYALAFAGFLLLGGRAADLFGRKRTFLTGLALFTAASLAGGLAQNPTMLITARVVQGLGSAVLAPTTLSILTTSFPEGPERTRAIGTWTAVGAGGGAAGGLVGGLLTDLLSWRWVLLVNVPIGALVLVGAALWLTESRGATVRRLDVPGAVLVTGGVAAIAYGIAQTESHGWTSAVSLGPLIGGFAILALFTAVEARAAQPLIPLRLFTIRSVASANTVLFTAGAATFATWYFLSLYMQQVLHYSPIRTGLSFLPHTVAIIIGSKLAPRLMGRIDARLVAAAGGLVAVAGALWQSRITADGTFLGIILGPGILTMLGAGMLLTPVSAVAMSGVGRGDQGLVSGLLNTSRQLGGALGLTVLATAAASRISTRTSGGAGSAQALSAGYGLAFLIGAAFIAAGTCLVVLLPKPVPRAQ
ncbi:MFS transporter [Actinacidiphila paucisporea]|uniref:Drug resistance transporter, EmrB/QacA subfamily n=1 Tax=Actinacidiphila paucisporea TaxID=310782 RepID=A0A1M6XP50_9ACTN|nr:MFS transporter [Actinacidiphila paucisporea]SHL07792.1 drug resistance transporter, EmrB/QacA subfamily [Actinacidiphila paucisporea]